MISLLARMTNVVGVDSFRVFYLNRRFIFMNIFMVIWLSSMTYPVYAEWPNIFPMLTSLTHITLFIVTGVRMQRHIADGSFVERNRDRLIKFHEKYESDEELGEILRARVRQLKYFAWTLGILYANFYSIHLFFFAFFLLTGKHQLAVPVHVPFTDPNTDFGFFINTFTCQVVAMYGLFVFTSYDIYFVIFGAHSAVMVDVMSHKLKTLSTEVREKMEENLRKELVEIIDDFQEYKAHLNEFSYYFQTNNVFSIFTTTFAICFNALLVLGSSNKLQSAIGLLSTSHIFVFCLLPCAMGTFIENQVRNSKF